MKYIFYLFTTVIVFINISNAQQGMDTIEVTTGWNLIGSLLTGNTLDIISTEPPGIIEGTFYGYNPGGGYYGTDTLNRAKGYWVKVSQNGLIVYASLTDCGMVDYGKIYNTVRIGDQCWLKENLDVGTMIQGDLNQTNNGTIEKYCYSNDPNNCNILGGLYQWDEMMQYSTTPGVQGICPPGWHVPTLAEFQTLSSAVGGDGNSLKAVGQGTGSGAGTNTSGFSALLAGDCWPPDSIFQLLGMYGFYWSSTEVNTTNVHNMFLSFDHTGINFHNEHKSWGFSIRCLKD